MREKKNKTAYSIKIIRTMIQLYCRSNHKENGELCESCNELLKYSIARFELCPHSKKTPCSLCEVNCYKPEMRSAIREVMKFSGPRMFLRHPIMSIVHIYEYLSCLLSR